MFHTSAVQESIERILYIWALRHPASGYVQGINDLVTPFYFVFLGHRAHEERVSARRRRRKQERQAENNGKAGGGEEGGEENEGGDVEEEGEEEEEEGDDDSEEEEEEEDFSEEEEELSYSAAFCDVDALAEEVIWNVEADTFWCLSKLLEGIQVKRYIAFSLSLIFFSIFFFNFF